MNIHLGRLAALVSSPVRSPRLGRFSVATADPVPVTLGGVQVRQADQYSCGALALLMLEATGNPSLAAQLEADPKAVTERQREYLRRAQSKALGPLNWPARAGVPPWTLAREATFPGVRYIHKPVDDSTAGGESILQYALHATAEGIPVPLYTGGNISGGIGRAIPRHVVLAVPPVRPTAERALFIFDPSSGNLTQMSLESLLNRHRPSPALGNWTHVVWAVLPVPVGDGGRP